MVSTIVAESGFYFAHRLCHETRLYYFHKRHHEYKDSTVYATFYVGLLDSVITDFIPAGFGIVYFEMHQWTVVRHNDSLDDETRTQSCPCVFRCSLRVCHRLCVLWLQWMFTLPLIANALRVHCGYDNAKLLSIIGLNFNPAVTLPLCTDAERTHDMHHRYNTCNFGGAYFVLDRIFGTWMNPDQEIADKKAGKPIVTRTRQFNGSVQEADSELTKKVE
jgi:sterol desaturase/sphingolipid hydroxylase (fatty acid hydroxylase superfamily)